MKKSCNFKQELKETLQMNENAFPIRKLNIVIVSLTKRNVEFRKY